MTVTGNKPDPICVVSILNSAKRRFAAPVGRVPAVVATVWMEKGAVTGFVVGPKGTGAVFASTGLKQGDVVTQINGVGIRSVEDATSAMGNVLNPGQTTFTVDRGGKPVTVVAGGAK